MTDQEIKRAIQEYLVDRRISIPVAINTSARIETYGTFAGRAYFFESISNLRGIRIHKDRYRRCATLTATVIIRVPDLDETFPATLKYTERKDGKWKVTLDRD